MKRIKTTNILMIVIMFIFVFLHPDGDVAKFFKREFNVDYFIIALIWMFLFIIVFFLNVLDRFDNKQ
jgi:hypothetical protein